jgi:hypothetical protein
MDIEADIKQLRAAVEYMKDRQDILDCIIRNSSGNDRFDVERVNSSYHSDALHELGCDTIPGAEYGEHANHAHGAMCDQNMHHITMHSCHIEGQVAHAESYVIALFLDKGADTSRILSGRYIDRLEKREGEWRIVVRRATVEVVLEGSAKMMEAIRQGGYIKGSRGKNDLAYAHPLGLDGGERW